jgi:hypothetical protein
MVKVLVELLLTHDANLKLPVTELHVAMTDNAFPLPASTDVGNFKVKALFFAKQLFYVDYTACTGRNVRKLEISGHISA